jgi:hypothetical protein
LITKEELSMALAYDPSTGIVTRVSSGCEAGYLHKASGYRLIMIKGRMYKAHRIAYLLMKGYWPDRDMDHIDGIRHNNVWSNLRLATKSQNGQNGKKRQCNTSGHKGVHKEKFSGRWKASITVNYKHIHLGRFTSKEAAIEAYKKASTDLHGEFGRIE